MTREERAAALRADRATTAELHQRAVDAANQAQIRLIQIEAQLALLDTLQTDEHNVEPAHGE